MIETEVRRAARAVDTAIKSIDAARRGARVPGQEPGRREEALRERHVDRVPDHPDPGPADPGPQRRGARRRSTTAPRSPSTTGRSAGCSTRRGSTSTIPRRPTPSPTASASAARRCPGRPGKTMAALEDSSFGRLIGVLVSPVKTFRSIAERPTWGVGPDRPADRSPPRVGVLANQRIDKDDMRQSIKEQMEKSQGGQATPEQIERGVTMGEKISSVTRWLIPVFIAGGRPDRGAPLPRRPSASSPAARSPTRRASR